jgi:hypothetical protein
MCADDDRIYGGGAGGDRLRLYDMMSEIDR